MADLSIVGRFAGTDSMAAVGTNASLIALILNLFVGISLGANIVIAQAIGSKNEEDAVKAVHTSVLLATVLSNLISSTILLVKMLRSRQEIRLRFRELRIHVDIMKRILYIGLPSGI